CSMGSGCARPRVAAARRANTRFVLVRVMTRIWSLILTAAVVVAPRLFLLSCLKHGIEGRLGLAVAIEQQGIIRPSADGEVVLPRIAVGHAPEGNTRHHVGVLDEDGEEVGVAFGKCLLDIVGQAGGVWVGATRGGGRYVGGVSASRGRQYV